MRVVFSAARQQSLFVPRTPFLAQTLKQFYVSSPSHLFTKPFLRIFRTVVQSPRYGRRRVVKIFNLEGIVVSIFSRLRFSSTSSSSSSSSSLKSRSTWRRRRECSTNERLFSSARRVSSRRLLEWSNKIPNRTFSKGKKNKCVFTRVEPSSFECKKYDEPRNASIFSQKCPAQKRKRRTPRSLTARVGVSSKRSGRNSPVMRRRDPFFFSSVLTDSERAVNWILGIFEDGSTTNNNTRAGT